MPNAYVAITASATAASVFVAAANFARLPFVRAQAATLGVAESWMPVFGCLHAAAALGLLLGWLGVPAVGTAAAAGLVVYFVGALVVHVRARDSAIGPATVFLVLAASALVVSLRA